MLEFILSAPFILGAVITIAIIIAVLLEFERDGWATTFFSLGIALVLWAYKSDIFGFFMEHTGQAISFAIGYVLIGLIWSLIKWKYYISTKTKIFNESKNTFIAKVGEIKSHWSEWIDFLNDKVRNKLNLTSFRHYHTPESIVAAIVPQAISKKSLIVSWISYWPISLAATLLNNPFRRFFESVYDLVSGIYDRMGVSAANSMLVGVEKNEELEISKKRK